METYLEGLSHQKRSLFYAIHLKSVQVSETLKVQGGRLDDNRLKTLNAQTMNVFCMTQRLFKESQVEFLYHLVKSLTINFNSLFVLMTEKVQKLTQKILNLQKKAAETPEELTQQTQIQDELRVPFREIKMPKLGGIHLYNEDYVRGLEDHRILEQLEYQKQNRIYKKKQHFLKTMIYQELEHKAEVEQPHSNDELSSYILQMKKKKNMLNYMPYEEELQQILTFFQHAQNDANDFLLKRARSDQYLNVDPQFSFADFQREIQIKNINLKKNVVCKFKTFVSSFNDRQKDLEQYLKQKEAYFAALYQRHNGVEAASQTEVDIQNLLKKSLHQKRQLELHCQALQELRTSQADIMTRQNTLRTEINLRVNDLRKLEDKKQQLEEAVSNLKKQLQVERSKKNILLSDDQPTKSPRTLEQKTLQKSQKLIQGPKNEQGNVVLSDDLNSEQISMMNSTRRLMYTHQEWKVRQSKDTSLCSVKDLAATVHDGLLMSKRHQYEPKKYLKHQFQILKKSEKQLKTAETPLCLEEKDIKEGILEQHEQIETNDCGVQTYQARLSNDNYSEVDQVSSVSTQKKLRLSSDLSDGKLSQASLRKTASAKKKPLDKLTKNSMTLEAKSRMSPNYDQKPPKRQSLSKRLVDHSSTIKNETYDNKQKVTEYRQPSASSNTSVASYEDNNRFFRKSKQNEEQPMLQIVIQQGQQEIMRLLERSKTFEQQELVVQKQRQNQCQFKHLYSFTIQPCLQKGAKTHELKAVEKDKMRAVKHSRNSTDVTLLVENNQKEQRQVKKLISNIPIFNFVDNESNEKQGQLLKSFKKNLINSHANQTLSVQEVQNIISVLVLSGNQSANQANLAKERSSRGLAKPTGLKNNRHSLPQLEPIEQRKKHGLPSTHSRFNSQPDEATEPSYLTSESDHQMDYLFRNYRFESSFVQKFKKAHQGCHEGPTCKHVMRYIQAVMKLMENQRQRQKPSLTMHVENIGHKLDQKGLNLKTTKKSKVQDQSITIKNMKENVLGIKKNQHNYTRKSLQKLSTSKMVQIPLPAIRDRNSLFYIQK